MYPDNTQFFEQVLFKSTGKALQVKDVQFLSGGCINNAVRLLSGEGDFFLKWNEQAAEGMFAAEAEGLRILRESGSLCIPEVLGEGKVEDREFLLLEFINSHAPSSAYWEDLGQSLAQLHSQTREKYGLEQDNFIGRLPQNNEQNESWVDFFIQKRLQVQLGLAVYKELVGASFAERFKALYPKLPDLLPEEQPSLLHGDLWSGNVMVGAEGQPCLIDPAVYYGHREAELAFTELFGGFDARFYAAYQEAKPLVPGYAERKDIYNIYPLMVHVNMFGTSYLSGVERTLNRYLK